MLWQTRFPAHQPVYEARAIDSACRAYRCACDGTLVSSQHVARRALLVIAAAQRPQSGRLCVFAQPPPLSASAPTPCEQWATAAAGGQQPSVNVSLPAEGRRCQFEGRAREGRRRWDDFDWRNVVVRGRTTGATSVRLEGLPACSENRTWAPSRQLRVVEGRRKVPKAGFA